MSRTRPGAVASRATGPQTSNPLADALGRSLARLVEERRAAVFAGDSRRVAYLDRVAARLLGQRLDAVAAALD